jgi:hypothetical protein
VGEGEGDGGESIAAQLSKKLSRLTKASSVITLNELNKANVVPRCAIISINACPRRP